MNEASPVSDLVRQLANGPQPKCIEAAKELARRERQNGAARCLPRSTFEAESGHAREMAAWLLGELSPGTDVTLDALHETINDPGASESLRGQAIESLGNQVSHLKGGEVL
jgi:hypothetical protein